MSDELIVRGRHITQHPGPRESQTIAAKFYAKVESIDDHYVKVRVDDELHPDFWLEVVIPVEVLRNWKVGD